ncbi:hypothetical protein D9M69_639490 [compost metagenome]
MTGLLAPHAQPDRGVVGAGAAAIDDVLSVRGGQAVEARSQSGETLGEDGLVAVEQGGSHVLGHALNVGLIFGQAERGSVAVEVGQRLVDFGIGLEHAAGIGHLRGSRLGGLDATVELAPRTGRQTGANGALVTSR